MYLFIAGNLNVHSFSLEPVIFGKNTILELFCKKERGRIELIRDGQVTFKKVTSADLVR
jgi:hypothetical protein